jgi:nitrate reductase gamma subunit
LLCRRLIDARVRYSSLPADYFALLFLFLLLLSGIFTRYCARVDLLLAKRFARGLVTFSPQPFDGLNWVFLTHFVALITLLVWFPLSKLMHAPGVLFSPTRNLANNSRAVRHVNPWNASAPYHTYEEWEADFREKMIAAGLPLDKS